MVMTPLNSEVTEQMNFDPKSLWYVPDRRIRTRQAALKAKDVLEWIATGQGLEEDPDEQTLFVAMHTCAYRSARRDPSDKKISMQKRMQWARRWKQIREYIVENNLGLVYSTIGRFGTKKVDEDDLLSDAMLALSRAIDRFNPWKGFRFSTYACNVIVRSLMRRGKVESNYRKLFPVQHDSTYEQPEKGPDLNTELYVERLNKIMSTNLGDLTELEYKILEQRFPSDSGRRKTFQKIGDQIGLSKERVRQIQNVALKKLRTVLDEDPLLR